MFVRVGKYSIYVFDFSGSLGKGLFVLFFVVVKKERFGCEKGENSPFIYPFRWYELRSLLQDSVRYKQRLR
jgi:hypothetical protein